jgi:hypothetical protein
LRSASHSSAAALCSWKASSGCAWIWREIAISSSRLRSTAAQSRCFVATTSIARPRCGASSRRL